jgi:predicted AlkP superfamily phosphohydrolase/phosphomutase
MARTQVQTGREIGPEPSVVVIGFDSADPELLLCWSKDGTLPTFAGLFEQAAWGRVDNDIANVSGTVWQSFHTGVWPGRHGFYDGSKYFDSQTYEDSVDFPSRADVPRETIWEILSRNQRRVAVIDAPEILPPEAINGLLLDGWGTHDRNRAAGRKADFHTLPEQLRGEVLAKYGEDPLGIFEAACDALKPRNNDELVWLRDAIVRRIDIKARLSADLLGQEPWSYFQTIFAGAHCIGHQCYHYHDSLHPRHDPAAAETLGDPFREVYGALDAALKEVIEGVPDDANVIVYASHGMGPNYTATGSLLERILLRLEGLESSQRAESAIGFARRIWRGLPAPLRRMGINLRARKFEARVQKLIQPERESRKFFQQHVNGATGGIRINLEGREAHGRVKPGTEYEALCESLTKDLLDMVNDETGEPLVANVLRSSEIYEGPFVGRMPDLMVMWNRSAPISRVRSSKIGVLSDPNPSLRSGDHTPQGMFFAMGPGVQAGETEPVAVVDFAPTVMALLGLEESDFDGQRIKALGAAFTGSQVS